MRIIFFIFRFKKENFLQVALNYGFRLNFKTMAEIFGIIGRLLQLLKFRH